MIANSNFEQGRFDKAEAGYASAQALMPANDPERAAIVERLAASIYKQGEQKSQSGDSAGAVEDFLRVSKEAPTSKVRANADFDAGALLITQKQWDRAIVVLEGFRRNFPQSPLQPDVTRKLAVAYSESNHPGQAAAEFEQIAQTPTESAGRCSGKRRCRPRICTTRPAITAKSRAMLEAFVKHFPQPLNPAMEARNKLSLIAAKSGDLNARDYWLKEIVNADRAAGAARTDRSKALAAKATLTLAAPAREEFMRIKLVAPLKKSLAEKRKAMEAALKAYTQAADYQVAEVTTAATFESAELYRQLGKDLDELGAPEEAVEGRARAIQRAARGAGVPVRGEGDQIARGQYGARQGRHLRRVGAEELRGAGATQSGPLRARWRSVNSKSNRFVSLAALALVAGCHSAPPKPAAPKPSAPAAEPARRARAPRPRRQPRRRPGNAAAPRLQAAARQAPRRRHRRPRCRSVRRSNMRRRSP